MKSTKTDLINFKKERIQQNIDNKEAVKQAIYMRLNTERGAFVIYPTDYGTNLQKYIGKPRGYVLGDVGREIKESLLNDDRVINVNNFQYETKGNTLKVKFTIFTIYGDIEEEVSIVG